MYTKATMTAPITAGDADLNQKQPMRETQQNKTNAISQLHTPNFTKHLLQPKIKDAESTMVKVPEGRAQGRRPGGQQGSLSPLCVSTDFGPPGRPFGHV